VYPIGFSNDTYCALKDQLEIIQGSRHRGYVEGAMPNDDSLSVRLHTLTRRNLKLILTWSSSCLSGCLSDTYLELQLQAVNREPSPALLKVGRDDHRHEAVPGAHGGLAHCRRPWQPAGKHKPGLSVCPLWPQSNRSVQATLAAQGASTTLVCLSVHSGHGTVCLLWAPNNRSSALAAITPLPNRRCDAQSSRCPLLRWLSDVQSHPSVLSYILSVYILLVPTLSY
jgi:hypothetical protein